MAIAAKALGPGEGHVDATTKGSRCRARPTAALASLPPLSPRCWSSSATISTTRRCSSRRAPAPSNRTYVSTSPADSRRRFIIAPRSHQISPRPALHGCRTSSHRICSPQLSADAAARSRDARPHLLPSHQHFCDDDDDPSILRSSVPGILRFSGNLSIFSTLSSSVAARA